ncbi:MAG: S8 family serine peptidase [Marinirhabdus sp.]|nr:S8 family serine peptidase [Marinirhabdus sp.]
MYFKNILHLAIVLFSITAFAQTYGQKPKKLNTTAKTVTYNKVTAIGPIDYDSPSGNGINSDKLKQLQAKFELRNKARKEEALAYAFIHNIPVKKSLPDGGFSELQFISEEGIPIYYRTYNSAAAESTRADWLNTGGGLGLDLNGDNLVGHVWDGGHARVSHQDYDGPGGTNRVTLMDLASEGGTQLNFHAAHVTGTVMATGIGNFGAPFGTSKGMAWQSDSRGYMWNNDVAEATGQVNDGTGGGTFNFGYDMLLSNHSYGYIANSIPDAWFGQYGFDAVDWDDLMYSAPYYLMVVAAGNDGNDNSSNGNPLSGNIAFDKLSGHATAKNNLVVANANDAVINPDGSLSSVVINSGSSEGPTDDFRIKPDITGNGTSLASTGEGADDEYIVLTGTSMASPNVMGSLLLLQEHYENLHSTPMKASTLKGIALHTADDSGLTGPDAVYGWGLLNSKKAAETITTANADGDAEVMELSLNSGATYTVNVLANGTEPLMASISWTDPAGAVNTGTNSTTPALRNDLDITLDNGTTYYPWRLTGVNSNSQTARNNVDPFERVDVAAASGVYTLTVTHDDMFSANQDFALVITGGRIVAGSPQIAFGSTSGSGVENSECGFTDIDVPVVITAAASEDADVTFTINGSGTAINGIDFDLMTPSVTFPSGSTTSQTMTLRIYEDGFVEGDETIIVDFMVNANGGDATANPSLDTYSYTITNDDTAPSASVSSTVFNADFEDTTGWTVIDEDGDMENWSIFNPVTYGTLSGDWAGSIVDQSVIGGSGLLTPDNYISSPIISIPSGSTTATLSFVIGDLGSPENYTVYFSSSKTSAANIMAGTTLESRSVSTGIQTETRTIDISGLAGQTGYLSFRHHAPLGNSMLMLDTILIESVVGTDVQTAVNTGAPYTSNINGVGTLYATGATGDAMAAITNNQNDDYGCTTIAVSRAGTGAQGYNGSTGVNQVFDKRFTITPSSSISGGDTEVTLYIDDSEIAGWESATGNTSGYTLYIAREVGGGLVDVAPATVGSFGIHTTLTASMTGLDGDYYIGLQEAFINCVGVTKIWNGSTWSPAGAPGSTDTVIIDGTYDTGTDGNLEACTITVNAGETLTVNAQDYIRAQGDITVDGSLIVEHQGSVVQVDPSASVIKNGIINVEITTPVLQTLDFMVMGSPMDAETRNGVFNSAFLVLNHSPNNFNPHTHPNIPQGATNFKDLEGDFWSSYSGSINVGEGYIVRPQSGYTDPANTTFDMAFEQGTLNNGTVNRTKVYNSTNSPSGTPNIYANPYPSGISSDAFLTENGLNALYFWEHLTPPSVIVPGESIMFDMDDVSIRNLGGGVAANNDNPANVPDNVISTAQGFGIKATSNGSVTFLNSMRVTSGNTTLRNTAVEVDRLWLHIESNTYELANNLMIGFNPIATNGWDNGYDTDRLASSVGLYSHLETGDAQMAIQTRGSFNASDKVELGFASLIAEETLYTISLTNFEGSNLVDRTIYLYDKHTGILTDLTQTDYEFRSNKATHDRRFTLVFEPDTVLGTQDVSLSSISVFPNPTNGYVNIVAADTVIEGVTVYDVLGRQLVQLNTQSEPRIELDLSTYKAALYFIEIETPNGNVTKRILKE